MSHTITFRISSKKLKEQKDLVKKLEEEVNALIEKIKDNKDLCNVNLQVVLDRINRFKQELMWMNNTQFTNNIFMNKTLSTFEKEVANLKYFIDSLNNQETRDVVLYYQEQVNLANVISDYGLLGLETLKQMYLQKLSFSDEKFNEYLNEQRKLRLNDKEYNELKQFLVNLLMQSNLPDNIVNKFKYQAMNLKTNQELNDLIALVQTVINNFNTLKQYVEVINNQFFRQGFSLDTTKPVSYDTDEHGIYVTYYLKNASNNTVKIKLYNNGEISYKLGNYIGHACEKTTQDVFNGLEEIGYDHEIISVQRNVDDEEPIGKILKKYLKLKK